MLGFEIAMRRQLRRGVAQLRAALNQAQRLREASASASRSLIRDGLFAINIGIFRLEVAGDASCSTHCRIWFMPRRFASA